VTRKHEKNAAKNLAGPGHRPERIIPLIKCEQCGDEVGSGEDCDTCAAARLPTNQPTPREQELFRRGRNRDIEHPMKGFQLGGRL
jgi:hypothetical protein